MGDHPLSAFFDSIDTAARSDVRRNDDLPVSAPINRKSGRDAGATAQPRRAPVGPRLRSAEKWGRPAGFLKGHDRGCGGARPWKQERRECLRHETTARAPAWAAGAQHCDLGPGGLREHFAHEHSENVRLRNDADQAVALDHGQTADLVGEHHCRRIADAGAR